ncbi:MAG: hypothetical protein L3J22_05800 [Xanthomonadales bacterium]|nr:hypothetical protein [Xanthomonadales bacterium]
MEIITSGSLAEAAAAQEVNADTFGAMQARFDGKVGAFAYLLFILLYTPCVAAVTAIVREVGAGWATFISFWTLGFAYLTATVFFQISVFSRHPMYSGSWIQPS